MSRWQMNRLTKIVKWEAVSAAEVPRELEAGGRTIRLSLAAWAAMSFVWLAAGGAFAQAPEAGSEASSAPLHARIDQLVEQHLTAAPAPLADDGTRVRRLYLDLTGSIPTAKETLDFLEDTASDKWPRLIDRLLSDERFVSHMANRLDVIFLERRADKHVPRATWEAYLQSAVRENRAFHQLAAELLAADGRDAKQRGPAKFYLERDAEPNLLTRDIGRVFFGVDMQCAQCHNHPLIDDYYQADYYGLYSFVSRLSLFTDKKQKLTYLSEAATGEVKFSSVFTEEEGRTNPRLPFDREIGEDPLFPAGEEFLVKATANAGAVPRYSRRAQLAEAVVTGQNDAFRRNIANRLWAMMMGRGLVHPVDLHHSDNPPSHPELLRVLSDEIAAMEFDMRSFLRELALTDTYQRDFVLPEDWLSRRPLESLADERKQWEQSLEKSKQSLTEVEDRYETTLEAYATARREREVADEVVKKAQADAGAKKSAWEKLAAPLDKAKATVAAQAKTLKLLGEANAALEKAGLAPDELASVLKPIQAKATAFKGLQTNAEAEVAKLEKAAAPAKAAWEQVTATIAPAQKTVEPLARSAAAKEQEYQLVNRELQVSRREHAIWQQKLEESAIYATAVETARAASDSRKHADAALAALIASEKQRAPVAERYAAEKAELESAVQAAAVAEESGTGSEDAAKVIAQVELKLPQTAKELAVIDDEHKKLVAKAEEAKAKVAAAQAPVGEAVAALEEEWSRRFAMTGLRALTPEQLCWSILQSTGQIELQQTAAAAELNKKQPLSADDQKDPAKVAAREVEIRKQAQAKLQGNVAAFVTLFAAAAGQPQDEFFATADQALFFRNGSQIRGWIVAGGNSLYQQLRKVESPSEIAEQVYVCVLSRRPDAAEEKAVVDYLNADPQQRDAAIEEIIWALLTSIEFRFRH